MNVGTSTCCRMGYIMQNPTDSRNERASSKVRTARPSKCHFSRRKLSRSVIKVLDHRVGDEKISRCANGRVARRLGAISIQSRRIAMRSKHLCTVARIAAACVMAMLARQSAQAQTYKVLHTFAGGNGANPAS